MAVYHPLSAARHILGRGQYATTRRCFASDRAVYVHRLKFSMIRRGGILSFSAPRSIVGACMHATRWHASGRDGKPTLISLEGARGLTVRKQKLFFSSQATSSSFFAVGRSVGAPCVSLRRNMPFVLLNPSVYPVVTAPSLPAPSPSVPSRLPPVPIDLPVQFQCQLR